MRIPSEVHEYLEKYSNDNYTSDNQKFFFNQSIKSVYNIISIEKEYLKDNNIEPPTQDVISKAAQLIKQLALKDIHPNRIATSAEDGICMTFKKGDEICYLELYNDGEMGYIIENRVEKTVIANEDLFSLNESISAIEDFYGILKNVKIGQFKLSYFINYLHSLSLAVLAQYPCGLAITLYLSPHNQPITAV